jgi:hypothetical protein
VQPLRVVSVSLRMCCVRVVCVCCFGVVFLAPSLSVLDSATLPLTLPWTLPFLSQVLINWAPDDDRLLVCGSDNRVLQLSCVDGRVRVPKCVDEWAFACLNGRLHVS